MRNAILSIYFLGQYVHYIRAYERVKYSVPATAGCCITINCQLSTVNCYVFICVHLRFIQLARAFLCHIFGLIRLKAEAGKRSFHSFSVIAANSVNKGFTLPG